MPICTLVDNGIPQIRELFEVIAEAPYNRVRFAGCINQSIESLALSLLGEHTQAALD
jgi:hypothetical protein